MSNSFTVHQVKSLYIFLILTHIWDGIAFITHPFINISPLTILGDPHLCEDAPKFTARVLLWTPEFNLNIILLGCNRLETPLLQLLLGKESILLLFGVRCA